MNEHPSSERRVSRRRLLQSAAVTGAALGCLSARARGEDNGPLKGRIKQSVAFWCFNSAGDRWDVDKTCQVAKDLGCKSVELVGPDQWAVLKKHGLVCAIAPNGMPGAPFMRGFNNTDYHEEVISRTKKALDGCAEAGFPAVIAFTGYHFRSAMDPTRPVLSRDATRKNTDK